MFPRNSVAIPAFLRDWALRNAGMLLAAVSGLGWLVFWAGPRILDPTHVSWLLVGEDWHQNVLGWWFFRNEPWAFPLGNLSGYVYPVGKTIGFTDTTPWVAILLKPLSPLLPLEFQFIGPWLGLCFPLQGAAGAWVARRHGAGWLGQWGAGALFAFSPVLAMRVGHPSLCAQFALTLLIGLHLERADSADKVKWALWAAWGLVLFAAGIHPYLAAMVLALAVALPWKIALADGRLGAARAALVSAAFVVTTLAVFALLGYLSGGAGAKDIGFGVFSSDLLSLVNPKGKSRFLPTLPSAQPNYEGYGYLGAGTLVLLAFALLSIAVRSRHVGSIPWRRLVAIGVVSAGGALFAFGDRISLGPRPLVDLSALYEHLGTLAGAFRSSGRFIWILHYTVIALVVLVILRLWRARPWVAAFALLAGAAVQAADFNLQPGDLFVRRPGPSGLKAPEWEQLGDDYRHLALVPAQIAFAAAPCNGELWPSLPYYLAYIAYRERMTINSGQYARRGDQDARYCADLRDQIGRGELDPETVYVLGEQSYRSLLASGAQATCASVDGYRMCVDARRRTALEARLKALGR